MKILPYIPILLVLGACQHAVSKTEHVKAVVYSHLPDSMMLTKPGAVVISPSVKMIDKKQKELTSDDYDVVIDDNVWYMDQSEHYLDSVKCYKVQRESEGDMKFRTVSGKIYNMKLSTYFFGILLFNGKDKPINASLTDFEEDYEKYMKK